MAGLANHKYQSFCSRIYLCALKWSVYPYEISIKHTGDASMLDITNPGAQEWLWEQFERILDEGVDGLWIDLTEPEYTIENGQFYLGPEKKVHNIYNNIFAETIYKGWRANIEGKRVFNLTRAGFAGIQRYGAINWSGDASKTWIALKLQVPMTIGSAMSGMPHYSSDIGGFTNAHDRTDGLTIFTNFDGKGVLTTPELYIRWFQFGVFSPMLRPHSGEEQYCEPFAHGPEAEKISAHYLNWRYKLIPYLYTYAHRTTSTGEQLVKPLFMQFDDEQSHGKDYQYMFGNEMMVAPVLDENTTSLDVYFPALQDGNKWISFWDDKVYEPGQTTNVPADLATIPVFVPQSSIIPIGKVKKHVGESPDDTLTWRVYPGNQAQFTLYEDDGLSYGYENGEFALTSIESNMQDGDLSIELKPAEGSYYGMLKERVYIFDIRLVGGFESILKNGTKLNEGEYIYNDETNSLQLIMKENLSKPIKIVVGKAVLPFS